MRREATPIRGLHIRTSDTVLEHVLGLMQIWWLGKAEPLYGEAGAVILESDLPKFFVDLGKAVASQNMNWETWIAGHGDEFKKIVEKYA